MGLTDVFAALLARDRREFKALQRFFTCLKNRGHSFDVDGQCSICEARADGTTVGQMIAEEIARREGN